MKHEAWHFFLFVRRVMRHMKRNMNERQKLDILVQQGPRHVGMGQISERLEKWELAGIVEVKQRNTQSSVCDITRRCCRNTFKLFRVHLTIPCECDYHEAQVFQYF